MESTFKLPTSLNLAAPTPAVVMSDETFAHLREFIYQKTGIYFQDMKKYLLEGRLGKRLRLLNMHSFEEYLRHLRSSAGAAAELQELFNHVTINETYFFRNDAQFEVLEKALIPKILAAKAASPRKKLRIWSSASSSGEEAYTLAMIFLEKIKPKYPTVDLEIVGTDINAEVLATARRGVYRQFSVRSMPEYYMKKYLKVEGQNYVVSDQLRPYVRFEHCNLYDHAKMRTMRQFDVIYCCNVLIYFNKESKIQIVSDLYDALNPGGYMFIGHSESLHGISSAFTLQSHPHTVVYSKE